MSIGVAVFIFGAILLLIALLGGGFEVKELKVPQVNQAARMIATGTGAIFIVTGIILGMRSPEGLPPTTSGTPPTAAPPTTTAVTTPPPAFPTAQEEALLLHVPKDFRAKCTRVTATLPQTVAKVVCTPSTDAKSVWYYRFSTTEKMYDWYFNFVDGKNIPRAAGNCLKDPVAEYAYPIGLNPVGHLACYRDGGKSYLLWTYDKLAIGVVAYRNDLNGVTLYLWWFRAGPLDPGVF